MSDALNCYPLRCEYEMTLPIVNDAACHPPPERTSRDPMPPDLVVPAPVPLLARHAVHHGWNRPLVTYSRAWNGTPVRLKHILAVRISRSDPVVRHAIGFYQKPVEGGTWQWDSIWLWGSDFPLFTKANHTDLKHYLAGVGTASVDVLNTWLAAIAAMRLERALAAKAKPKAKRKAKPDNG